MDTTVDIAGWQHITPRGEIVSGAQALRQRSPTERWDSSRRNIIALMPSLTEVKIFDNSEEGDPAAGTIPEPKLLLHWRRGTIVAPTPELLATTPEWARPIIARALQLQRAAR